MNIQSPQKHNVRTGEKKSQKFRACKVLYSNFVLDSSLIDVAKNDLLYLSLFLFYEEWSVSSSWCSDLSEHGVVWVSHCRFYPPNAVKFENFIIDKEACICYLTCFG